MESARRQAGANSPIECTEVRPARAVPGLIEDVETGLFSRPRSLPPKYFYDEYGSQLFDRICSTPEYYLTRTEDALLAERAHEVIDRSRPVEILELGSGSCAKTRRLLDACEALDLRSCYAPFDVCEEMLLAASGGLLADYQWLRVRPLLGDYHAGLEHLPNAGGPRLYVFLGSTIGNFEADSAGAFLRELAAVMRPGDWLLMGADRLKEKEVLSAAYNDAAGITAEFNRNVLRVLNRELDADFEVDAFRHQALWQADERYMEMRLVADDEQRVRFERLDRSLALDKGEFIRTEISRKFTRTDLESLFASAGLRIDAHFEPENGYFSLLLGQRSV
jgi:L-histidine N-alpha-methyltransferase